MFAGIVGSPKTGGGTNDVGFFFLRFVALLKINPLALRLHDK